jgi:hypothetical protein
MNRDVTESAEGQNHPTQPTWLSSKNVSDSSVHTRPRMNGISSRRSPQGIRMKRWQHPGVSPSHAVRRKYSACGSAWCDVHKKGIRSHRTTEEIVYLKKRTTPMCTCYGGGAVYKEKTSCKGACSFWARAWSLVVSETGFLGDLVRFLIAYPIKHGLI